MLTMTFLGQDSRDFRMMTPLAETQEGNSITPLSLSREMGCYHSRRAKTHPSGCQKNPVRALLAHKKILYVSFVSGLGIHSRALGHSPTTKATILAQCGTDYLVRRREPFTLMIFQDLDLKFYTTMKGR